MTEPWSGKNNLCVDVWGARDLTGQSGIEVAYYGSFFHAHYMFVVFWSFCPPAPGGSYGIGLIGLSVLSICITI